MKNKTQKIAIISMFLAMVFVSVSGKASEKEAVREVVQSAYVDGFQNLGGRNAMEKGFHPDFVMVLNRSGELSDLPLERMIEITEQRSNNPEYQHVEVKARFLDIDITGNAAMVKIELFRDGEKLFTDYLGLYKFDDGWKIFNKLYHQH